MQKLPANGPSDADQLGRLMRISDERVCTAVEIGKIERLYFQRVLVPGMNNHNGVLVHVNRPRWLPVTGPVQAELLAIVRNELRPVPVEHNPPKAPHRTGSTSRLRSNIGPAEEPGSGASRSRRSLAHRPTTRRHPQQTESPASH